MRVSIGRQDFENAVLEFQDGDIKGSPSEIVDGDISLRVLLQPISQGRRGGFIDDPQHFKAGNEAGILRRLSLAVVEIGRDRNDGLSNFLAQVRFCPKLEFFQDHGGDLRGGIGFLAHLDADHAAFFLQGVREIFQFIRHVGHGFAHEPFHGIDRAGGVADEMLLGGIPNQEAVIRETYDRRDSGLAAGSGDDPRAASVHIRDQ